MLGVRPRDNLEGRTEDLQGGGHVTAEPLSSEAQRLAGAVGGHCDVQLRRMETK